MTLVLSSGTTKWVSTWRIGPPSGVEEGSEARSGVEALVRACASHMDDRCSTQVDDYLKSRTDGTSH